MGHLSSPGENIIAQCNRDQDGAASKPEDSWQKGACPPVLCRDSSTQKPLNPNTVVPHWGL